jgi:pSer/pThr/pTyr-binding forkhead associated (FHA) protein
MARLIINDGSNQRTVELVDTITVAGRSPDNKVAIEDKQASRRHCQFERTEWGTKLVDLESRNGTRVNDRVVNQALLRPGDRVQIGKHVLVFEDPSWKEPPADIAARFAPPPPVAPVPVAPAPVVAGPPPPAPPAPAPGSPPAAPAEPPPIRRRTGATTRIERVHRFERQKEQKLLTWVGVGAGVFIFILLVLIIIPSGEPAGARGAREAFDRGALAFRNKDYDGARRALRSIASDQQPYFSQAQQILAQIEADLAKITASMSADEQRDFNALYEFCDKRRADPTAVDRMRGMCEEFKQKYPRSAQMKTVEEFLRIAGEGQKGNKLKEVGDVQAQAQEDMKKGTFAPALRRTKELLEKFKTEIEAYERLVKIKEDIETQAEKYYNSKHAEARDLAARGRKDEATRVYEALIISMGDGQVEELADYCRNSRKWIEGFK